MPYPGVPKNKEKKMERCVQRVMGAGKDKSTAIAICRKSIMGAKKADTNEITITINLDSKALTEKAHDAIMEEISKQVSESLEKNGKEVKKTKKNMSKKIVKLADVFTADELEKMDDKMKECVKAALAEGKSKDEAMKSCGMKQKKADEATDVAKADADEAEEETTDEAEVESAESSEEEAEDASDEENADEEGAEDEGEVAKELDPIEVLKSISEMEDPKEIREAVTEALNQLVKTDDEGNKSQSSNIGVDVEKVLGTILEKVTVIEGLAKATDEGEADATEAEEGEGAEDESAEASAEGEEPEVEADAEETSEDTSADEPAEDEQALEKLEKVEESVLAKVDEKLTPIADALGKLEKAVKKIADSPAPSKIKSSVVEKGFAGQEGDNSARLDEVKKELEELAKVRDNDPGRYQRENLAEKAFQLLDERERLTLGL